MFTFCYVFFFFFFNDTATTEIYTLSLHDALPIYFVLSGGEPAALCVLDAVVRLLPGALGDHESAATDSHYDGLLSPPSYTRPPSYRGMDVPAGMFGRGHQEKPRARPGATARVRRAR